MGKAEKRELKNYIQQHGGFFLHLDALEVVTRDSFEEKIMEIGEKNAIKTKAKVPDGENIMIFRGLATQRFEKGKASRNGYKIDVEGWNWKNYQKNPQILLQHDYNQPIGKAVTILPQENGVEIQFYVNLDAMTPEDSVRVRDGLFAALSTGHITHEMMLEDNKTGKRLTFEEAREEGVDIWDVLWGNNESYTLVVTKAEAIEVSMVSLPSNPDALTFENTLKNHFSEAMKKFEKNAEGEAEEVTTPADPAVETPAPTPEATTGEPEVTPPANGDDTPASEAPAPQDENKVPQWATNVIPALFSAIVAQQNQIDALQNAINSIPNGKAMPLVNQFGGADAGKQQSRSLRNFIAAHGIPLQ